MKLDVRVEHPITLHASFEIRGFTALLGRSGAGKTTLLKALAGLIPATGTPGDGRPPEARRVGYLPQTAALFPHLTALENTAYALRGVDRFAQARRMLDALDLGDLAARPAAGLSGGQAQRIALARALAGNAQLLLLDEPSAALDATTRNATLTWLIDTITARQLPALAATHDPAVAGLADWVVLLSGRQIIQQGHPRDILSAPASKAAAELLGYENIWDEAAIRAADVEIAADGMPATILSVREQGAGLHLRCTAEMPVTIHLRAGDQADYSPGAKICLQFPGDKLKRFKNNDVLF